MPAEVVQNTGKGDGCLMVHFQEYLDDWWNTSPNHVQTEWNEIVKPSHTVCLWQCF